MNTVHFFRGTAERGPSTFGSIPLRIKLVAAMILPVIVVAGYLTLRVDGAFETHQVADRQEAEVGRFTNVSKLAQAVNAEQANIVDISAGNDEMVASRDATDAALAAVRADGLADEEMARIERLLAEVDDIRRIVGDDVNVFRGGIAGDIASGNTGEGSNVERALELSKIATSIFSGFEFDQTAIADVATAQGLGDIALIQQVRTEFAAEMTLALGMTALPNEARTADALEFIDEQQAQTDSAIENLTSLSTAQLGASAQEFIDSADYAEISAIRTTVDATEPFGDFPLNAFQIVAARNSVDDAFGALQAIETQRLFDNAAAGAASANSDLARSIGVGSVLFALVSLILVALYRAIRNPLARLTERSKDIAEVELPEIVTAMRSGNTDYVANIEPLVAESNDEIGELVEAFNGMHRTAIELAGEQAASRRVVADMFVNLGRRNQLLLNRMLKGLTALERNEQDPDALGALYDIDHLATRMRRNAESLLILAGAGQARRLKNPVTAYDVVRAALAEVEEYDRVEVDAMTDILVHGNYVADLTHLLAELIENALSFSPPTSSVVVVTKPTHRGFVIAVSDKGLGMSPELLVAANARIQSAATQDETPSEFLGHFVVGRLAARHNIKVDLLEGVAGGLTARVILPDGAVQSASGEPIEAAPAAPALAPQVSDKVLVPPSPAGLEGVTTDALVEPEVVIAAPVVQLADAGSTIANVTDGIEASAAAPATQTVFGTARRTPGASTPMSDVATLAPKSAGDTTTIAAAAASVEPDSVRSSLSGFQSGTARAEQED